MKSASSQQKRGALTAAPESEPDKVAGRPLAATERPTTDSDPGRDPQPAPGTEATRDVPDTLIGQIINKYRIVRKLGQGGMGMVYEAVHTSIGQRGVVKLLRPHLSQDPRYVERFFNEARAATIAQHASLVKIFDFGQTPSGALYMLMEHLEGESLRVRLQRLGCLDAEEAIRLARQIASGMAVVHARGIHHRDLKPDNIFLVEDIEAVAGERAKILDFGLARIADDSETGERQTSSQAIAGTPAYMAPEQCRGLVQTDAAADVYALGVILYELLAGQPPFVAELPGDLLVMHISTEPPPLTSRQPSIPPELARLVHRMLVKERGQRPTMQDIELELMELEARFPPTASQPSGARALARGTLGNRHKKGAQRWRILALVTILTLASVGAGRLLLWPVVRPFLSGTRVPTTVSLRGGSYTRGSSQVEIEAAYYWCQQISPTPCHHEQFEREMPAREVTISTFELDATEVTNQQFAAWLNQRRDLSLDKNYQRQVSAGSVLYLDLYPMHAQGGLTHVGNTFSALRGYEHRPVTQVTWDAAAAYCAAQGKRLPTEAEWEYAARGLQNYRFPWGFDEPRCDGVVISRSKGQSCATSGLGPSDVATAHQDRSAQGIYDLAGNVSEWVQDEFFDRHTGCLAGPCVDPVATGPAGAPLPFLRVVRGSDWSGLAVFGRAAARSRLPHDRTAGNVGFRCARSKKL